MIPGGGDAAGSQPTESFRNARAAGGLSTILVKLGRSLDTGTVEAQKLAPVALAPGTRLLQFDVTT